jgi:hypothetical protein
MLAEGAKNYGVDSNYVNWLEEHPYHEKNCCLATIMIILLLLTLLPVLLLAAPLMLFTAVFQCDRPSWLDGFFTRFMAFAWQCFGCVPGSGNVAVEPTAFHLWVSERKKD